MTRPTRATTAAVLPTGASPTRRTVLAGATTAAALALAEPAAALPSFDADAGLLALRSRWLEARARFAAETTPRHPAYLAAVADLPSVEWFDVSRDANDLRGDAIRARCEAMDRLDELWPTQPMSAEAEARQELAIDDEGEAMAEIAAMPARTLAGLGFKVEVSIAEYHQSPDMVASIMTDVAAFAAAHPTIRV